MNPFFSVFAAAAVILTAPEAVRATGLVVQGSDPVSTVQASPRVSQGIAEILKMADNGIDQAVIKDYIAHSSTIYQPTVDEIIYLHQKGLGSDVITSLIQRGADLRRNLPAPAALSPATIPGPETNPYPYSAPLIPPDYSVAPSYVEPYPVYTYGYPYAYSYPWSFGVYLGPSFYGHYYPRGHIGFGAPFGHFGGGVGFHGGGFRGSVGVHGGGGFHGGGGGGFHGAGGFHGGGGHRR